VRRHADDDDEQLTLYLTVENQGKTAQPTRGFVVSGCGGIDIGELAQGAV
jgi:hypothetical protein